MLSNVNEAEAQGFGIPFVVYHAALSRYSQLFCFFSLLFRSLSCTGNGTKFRILADGLLINKVTQFDTGEYTCRAFQVNSIASDMQERTVLMKIERECDL